MIEVTFKSKGSEHKGNIPQRWTEINCKQFMSFEALEDPIEILSAVMNMNLSFLLNSSTNLTPVMNRLINLLNERPISFDTPHKRGFKLLDKTVHFPKNINKMMFGQLIQINQLIDEGINRNLLKIASIAIQPIFDKEFDESRQPYFRELLEELPVIEVFPELFFFAEKLRKHKVFGAISSLEL